MNIVIRLLVGAFLAAGVTTGLLFVMYTLIATDEVKVDETPAQKLADIFMPETKIEVQRFERKPEKPEEPEEPPPEMEQPDLQDVSVDMDAISVGAPVKIAIDINAGAGFGGADGEYLPMNKVQAAYPRRAQSRGIEGYCTVEYTVTKSGRTRDVKIADCPNSIFARNSIKAAERFKYKPRIVDGEPMEVSGVQNKFIFKLE